MPNHIFSNMPIGSGSDYRRLTIEDETNYKIPLFSVILKSVNENFIIFKYFHSILNQFLKSHHLTSEELVCLFFLLLVLEIWWRPICNTIAAETSLHTFIGMRSFCEPLESLLYVARAREGSSQRGVGWTSIPMRSCQHWLGSVGSRTGFNLWARLYFLNICVLPLILFFKRKECDIHFILEASFR